MTDNMDDILEKYPEFENKLYIIGGSRREALKEAMAILLRLTFIDSLEKLHLKGQPYNREEVIKKLSCCPHPVIAVSEETAPIGPDTVQFTNGAIFSLTVSG